MDAVAALGLLLLLLSALLVEVVASSSVTAFFREGNDGRVLLSNVTFFFAMTR